MVRSAHANPYPDPDTHGNPATDAYPTAQRNSRYDASSLICFSSQSRLFIR